MHHAIGAGILAAGVTLALGCTPATSPLDLAGSYALVTVNGSPLPFVLSDVGGVTVELLEDRFTLNPGGTYSEAGYKRHTIGAAVSITFPVDAGNFTRRGEVIRLESLLFPARTGRIRQGDLTLVDRQFTLVYRK